MNKHTCTARKMPFSPYESVAKPARQKPEPKAPAVAAKPAAPVSKPKHED